jgi:hypothetical protein
MAGGPLDYKPELFDKKARTHGLAAPGPASGVCGALLIIRPSRPTRLIAFKGGKMYFTGFKQAISTAPM